MEGGLGKTTSSLKSFAFHPASRGMCACLPSCRCWHGFRQEQAVDDGIETVVLAFRHGFAAEMVGGNLAAGRQDRMCRTWSAESRIPPFAHFKGLIGVNTGPERSAAFADGAWKRCCESGEAISELTE